jgi:hypothetical protein
MRHQLMEVTASYTAVHRVARRFLEPIQDVLVLGIGLTLFALISHALPGARGAKLRLLRGWRP